MNNYTEDLLALARRVVADLSRRPWFGAAMVAGSVAHNKADRFSDVDILLFTSRPLTAEEMQAEREAAEGSGGGFYGGSPDEGFALWLRREGTRCDISYAIAEQTEGTIAEMETSPTTNTTTQLILGGIQRGVPLHGVEQIEGWQERARRYPEALARMMVEENLRQQPCHIWRGMGAERGDRLFLYEAFLRLVERLVGVLCGLNRVWHPGKLKGLDLTLGKLSVAPRDFAPRINALFTLPLPAAVEEAVALVEETFALVEEKMPEVDVAGARSRFALQL